MKLQKPGKSQKQKLLGQINWRTFHPHPVIGVDEAGRGCLFGPVYAGAVFFKSEKGMRLFKDSKQLPPEKREELFELIREHHVFGVGTASVEEINEMNILWASMLAMKRAIYALGVKVGHVLIDGNRKIPDLNHSVFGYEFSQTAIVKGDHRVKTIAAASIVAKVSRDRHLVQLAQRYSHYGLEHHKGYATALHKKAILQFGPTTEHRKFFAGVKEYWGGKL
jgi:ribonuclease HII